jgi:hypothetical protein
MATSNGHIKIQTTEVAPEIYQVTVKTNKVTRGLSAADYADFREDMEFAGVSVRGKLLSIPKSKGTVNISGYPLKTEHPGNDWVDISCVRDGALLTTKQPTVLAVLTDTHGWQSPMVFVPKSTLLSRFSLRTEIVTAAGNEDVAEGDIAAALYFHAHYPSCHIAQSNYALHIVFPKGTELQQQEWERLCRYIYNGKTIAPFSETVPQKEHNCIWFPGVTLQEVQNTYGIEGTPVAFSNQKLGFNRFRIITPAKASKAFPVLEKLGAKSISLNYSFICRDQFTVETFLKNPRLVEHSSEIHIDASLTSIRVGNIDAVLPFIDYPLCEPAQSNSQSRTTAFCPQHLVDQFFLAAREAGRAYKLDGICRYTINYGGTRVEDLPGQWVLRDDVTGLKARDRRSENQTKQARKEQLEGQFGKLPKGWEKLTDEQVGQYFLIQDRLVKGELLEFDKSALMPKHWSNVSWFKTWLLAQTRIVKCPLTSKEYVQNFTSMDELAQVPGFWQALEGGLHEKDWLKALINSRTVQAIAMTELL